MRRREGDSVPRLSNMLLEGKSLQGFDLHGVDIRTSRLRKLCLSGAYLKGCRFFSCTVEGCEFRGADLRFSQILGSEFIDCDIQEARLGGSIIRSSFSGCNFDGAQLEGAALINTTISKSSLQRTSAQELLIYQSKFCELDLSSLLGLSSCMHLGPSTIGVDTLEKTAESLLRQEADLPDIVVFLRAAGVAEDAIKLFKSWGGRKGLADTVFISYCHSDSAFAVALYNELQRRGVRCWLDSIHLRPGDRILDEVGRAIQRHDRILVCCSEQSLKSWWVRDEIEKALERERLEGKDIIIPLNLDDYLFESNDAFASQLRSRVAADFIGWFASSHAFDSQFERVAKVLTSLP